MMNDFIKTNQDWWNEAAHGWNHTLSEIFDALLSAGLTIDFFHGPQEKRDDPIDVLAESDQRVVYF